MTRADMITDREGVDWFVEVQPDAYVFVEVDW